MRPRAPTSCAQRRIRAAPARARGEIDEGRAIPEEIYRAVQDAGLFNILKPRRYGGFELTEHDHAMVTLTLAKGCASTAWVFAILDSDNIAICSFPEETQEEIWGANPAATLAGNTNLNPAAEVERVPGGYRLSGTWGTAADRTSPSGSSSTHRSARSARATCSSSPARRPRRSTTGGRPACGGTGSRSKRVTRVFVPDRRVMRTADTTIRLEERRSLHPSFDATYAPWPSHGRFPFAATAVGAAVGAAEDFAESSGSLTRVAHALGGTTRLVEQDYVAAEFAEASGELEMAWDLVARDSREAAAYAGRHELPDERLLAKLHRDNALVTRVLLREVSRIRTHSSERKPGSPGTRSRGRSAMSRWSPRT